MKYYYNRYTVSSYGYYTETGDWVSYGDEAYASGVQTASNYSFSSSSGYSITGSILMEGNTTYGGDDTSLEKYVYFGLDGTSVKVHLYVKKCTRSTRYRQGSLVTPNMIAEDGTYPVNGIYGGYWYVRQGLAPSFFFMNF